MRDRSGAGSVRLSLRLQALADLVTPGKKVADVGCDHGFVSIYLVQNGISPKVYAMDVRKGPLSRAEEHIRERGLEAYIETRLSDGLEKLRVKEADALICAGMGGRLMQRILTAGEAVAGAMDELILQPQSEIREFRIFLRERGYGILRENIVAEEGKYYFLMKVAPGAGAEPPANIPQRLADKYGGSLLAGRHPVLREYLLREREMYRGIAGQIGQSADGGDKASVRLAEVKEELADLEEALKIYGGGAEDYGYSDN